MEDRPTNQDVEGPLSEHMPAATARMDVRMFQEDHVAAPHIAAYQVSATKRAGMICRPTSFFTSSALPERRIRELSFI